MQRIRSTFFLSFLAVTGLVIAGCSGSGADEVDTSNLKLVSLKVPNMT